MLPMNGPEPGFDVAVALTVDMRVRIPYCFDSQETLGAGNLMNQEQMTALVERHLKAEGAGDVEGAVAVYTDDVEHDVVGSPTGPVHGKAAARAFYQELTANFRTEEERPTHRYCAPDTMILDQSMTGTVMGSMLGMPGNGRRITFRILHVFEFRDGLISRENVWLDGGAIQQQLS
jgi:steroid delta-isomerase-like uncharacterized protein